MLRPGVWSVGWLVVSFLLRAWLVVCLPAWEATTQSSGIQAVAHSRGKHPNIPAETNLAAKFVLKVHLIPSSLVFTQEKGSLGVSEGMKTPGLRPLVQPPPFSGTRTYLRGTGGAGGAIRPKKKYADPGMKAKPWISSPREPKGKSTNLKTCLAKSVTGFECTKNVSKSRTQSPKTMASFYYRVLRSQETHRQCKSLPWDWTLAFALEPRTVGRPHGHCADLAVDRLAPQRTRICEALGASSVQAGGRGSSKELGIWEHGCF